VQSILSWSFQLTSAPYRHCWFAFLWCKYNRNIYEHKHVPIDPRINDLSAALLFSSTVRKLRNVSLMLKTHNATLRTLTNGEFLGAVGIWSNFNSSQRYIKDVKFKILREIIFTINGKNRQIVCNGQSDVYECIRFGQHARQPIEGPTWTIL